MQLEGAVWYEYGVVDLSWPSMGRRACRREVRAQLGGHRPPPPHSLLLGPGEVQRSWLAARCARCALCPRFLDELGVEADPGRRPPAAMILP